MSDYVARVFLDIKKKKVENSFWLNIHGVYVNKNEREHQHWVYTPNSMCGLLYREFSPGLANVSLCYLGYVTGFEVYRWTDLHKPKTEEALIEILQRNSEVIHQELISNIQGGSFNDFMQRFSVFTHWLNYYYSSYVLEPKFVIRRGEAFVSRT